MSAWSHADWSSNNSLNGTLALADPITAFADGEAVVLNRDEVSGKVVLIRRAVIPSGEHEGTNGFSVKALAAQNAGAVGVVFANNDEENADAVVSMRGDPVHIPVVMISHREGERAVELGAGTPVAIAGLNVQIDV